MGRIKVIPIHEHILLLDDQGEATGYLVTGTQKAVVIDAMLGYENVRELAESLTDLPVTLINTHGHSDHIYGNIYFDTAYMHQADWKLAEREYQHPLFAEASKTMGRTPAQLLPVKEGDVFDLGGVMLEVFETPGHTPGSIVLLDRKDRILFSGDTVIEQTWMQLPECCPMEVLLHSLDKIQGLRDEFDHLLTGHSRHLEDASLCEAHHQAVREVCEGQTQNDVSYTYVWNGEHACKAHPYGAEPRRIVYNEVK